MMYRLSTLLVMLFLSHGMWAQDCHQAFIKRVTDTIAYVGVVKCEAVSRIGSTPRQYIRFDSLRRFCSSAELQALLKHKSPAVRGYAFWALTERPEVDLYPLLLRHRQDRAETAQMCGCFGSVITVISSMLNDYEKSPQYARDSLNPERRRVYLVLHKEAKARWRKKSQHQENMTLRAKNRAKRRDDKLWAHDNDF
ncbi:hypothetical protein [Hymenobacter metallilatus]|uniref:HEAT repeat domain-containing protein n=1 Tax=Hymenobacter metallilatus TaxID=2493666 RepID=A0A3R9ULA1_9BACT|nr:hypothetical protein [Hymenobacter metallilatus]RSK34505.1 hypothetical protein EI290_07700 [Hymenobacter metallilatus]